MIVKAHPHRNKVQWRHERAVAVKRGNMPMDYVAWIKLEPVKFVVSEAGRNRVIKEHRRNVHAWAVGEEILSGKMGPEDDYWKFDDTWKEVRYNPYHAPYFIYRAGPGDWKMITNAQEAILWKDQCYARGINV